MDPKGIGKRSWLQKAAVTRGTAVEKQQAVKPQAAAGQVGLDPRAGRVAVDRGQLVLAGVPEKIAKEFEGALAKTAGDAVAIAAFGKTLETWRHKGFERAQAQLYKTLAIGLKSVASEQRAPVAEASIRAFRGLLDGSGESDALTAAMGASLGLYDLALRLSKQRRLTLTDAETVALMQTGVDATVKLKSELAGRTGVGTALNLYSVVVEILARAAGPLDAAKLGKIQQQAADFIRDTAPQRGLTMETAAGLSRALAKGLEQQPKNITKALAAATENFQAEHAVAREEIKGQLAQPNGLPEGTPARAAFDRLNAAFEAVVAANPAGPKEIYEAIFRLRPNAEAWLKAHGANPVPELWQSSATIIERLAATPFAADGIDLLGKILPHRQQQLVGPALDKAAQAADLSSMAAALIEASVGTVGRTPDQVAGLGAVLPKVLGAQPAAALQIASVVFDQVRTVGAHVAGLLNRAVEQADRQGRDDMRGFMAGYVTADVAYAQALTNANVSARDPQKREVFTAELAKLAATKSGANNAAQVTQWLQLAERLFPAIDLAPLLKDHADGSPGLASLADPTRKWKYPVADPYNQLVNQLSQSVAGRQDPAAVLDGLKLARSLAAVIGNLDGQWQIPFQRIKTDFDAAFRDPAKLQWAKQDALAARQPSVEAFLAAHPVLPKELALTAGLHLSSDQVAWLSRKVETTKGRDTLRALRDFVFACVTANRKDLIDAVIKTPANSKIVARTMHVIGRDYRDNKLAQIPWDQVAQGLAEGKDPIAQIEEQRMAAALGGIQLKGPFDVEGMAAIGKAGEAIRHLLEFIRPGNIVDEIDMGLFKEPFESMLQSVASGTWPATRYERPAAKEALANLSPAQKAIWMSETVVSEGGGAAPAAAGADQAKTLQTLRGLREALPKVKLAGTDLEALAWDKPSLERLEGRLGELVGKLREVQKGSDEHRALSKQIGPVRELTSLMRLHDQLGEVGADAGEALRNLKDTLADAKSALRKRGFGAASEAIDDLLTLANQQKPAAGGGKQGVYASDQDGLVALTMSTLGGCIQYNNFRRWATSNLAINGHEKIVRVEDGATFKYRAAIMIVEAEFPGYKGPALWMTDPNTNAGGNQQHLQLLVKAVAAKAKQMGIPAISRTLQGGQQIANESGMKFEAQNVKVSWPDGETGATFTNYMVAHNIRKAKGAQEKFSAQLQLNILKP